MRNQTWAEAKKKKGDKKGGEGQDKNSPWFSTFSSLNLGTRASASALLSAITSYNSLLVKT